VSYRRNDSCGQVQSAKAIGQPIGGSLDFASKSRVSADAGHSQPIAEVRFKTGALAGEIIRKIRHRVFPGEAAVAGQQIKLGILSGNRRQIRTLEKPARFSGELAVSWQILRFSNAAQKIK
jgi:hypothetical protein